MHKRYKWTNKFLHVSSIMIFSLAFNLLTYAQSTENDKRDITVSISASNTPLLAVLKSIEKQTGLRFNYSNERVDVKRLVSMRQEKVPLSSALSALFAPINCSWKVIDKNIFIIGSDRKNADDTFSNGRASDSSFTLSGRITDTDGNPVPGATIAVKDDTKGTTSNADGNFTLSNFIKGSLIQVSSIGFETRELRVNESKLLVRLNLLVSKLGAISVVSTGYQQLPEERATGSFALLNNRQISRSVSTDVLTRLKGMTSGLLIDPTNAEGGNPGVSIRGQSTIFANTTPLIILDNFPYDGDINNINPNDVESITVLKDAAAASIWGVRSGNGVIVITTKKGRYNVPLKVEFNANVTVSQRPDLFYNQNFLGSSEFVDLEKTLFTQGYYDNDINNLFGTYTPLSPVVDILTKERAGEIASKDADAMIKGLATHDVRRDLSKYFYRPAVNQQYAISLSGGGEKASYYFSTGYDRNLSSQVGTKNDRLTVNYLSKFTPVDKLEVTVGLMYTQANAENDKTLGQISTGGFKAYSIYPYAKLADEQGNPLSIVKDYNSDYVKSAVAAGFLDWQFFPLQELRDKDNMINSKSNDIRVTSGIKYNIMNGLSIEVNNLYQRGTTTMDDLASERGYFARNEINRYSILTNGLVTGYNIPKGGILNTSDGNFSSNTIRLLANLNHNWGDHSIAMIAGLEAKEVKSDTRSNTLYGYDESTATSKQINPLSYFFPLNPYGAGQIPVNAVIQSTIDRYRSYFANVAYTFRERYTISGSGRIDQSNLFGVKTNQRSVPLWSAGVSWNVANEKFYNINWLPMLKFRATYGYNGNINKTVTAYTTATLYPNVDYNGIPYDVATILLPGNPELRWEKIGIVNLGLEFGTRNARITGSLEYFHKNGKDIIGDAAVPSSTGFTSIRGNFANINGRGVDIVLNTLNIDKAVKWQSTFLFSYVTDKVTKYTGETQAGLTRRIDLLEGRPIRSIFSLPWGGLDPLTGNPRGYLADTLTQDYGTLNNMLLKDKVFSGSAQPTIFGSFINTITWKNLSLSFNIIYKARYYFRRNSIMYNSLFYSWLGHSDFSKRWQGKGDVTDVPSMPNNTDPARDNFYANSEVLVERGDHIRLQDIRLSYEFTRTSQRKLPFAYLQLYLYANNLGILWKANNKGIDPDYQMSYPAPRSIAIGLRSYF